jgi:ketosteroid isomerase-like protein
MTMALGILLSFAIPALGQQALSGPEQEVWAMEEAYWERVASGDVEAYLDLWDEAFVGWPCTSDAPATKESIGSWVAGVRDGTYEISYELERHAVRAFGDIAVAYYATPIVYRFADGGVDGEHERWKFIHTWQRQGDTWRILGGMCGLFEWGPAAWP